MAHTFDTKATTTESASNPVTRAYTCGAGATLLVVCITTATIGVRTGGAPTYNSVALTEAQGPVDTDTGNAEIWYMLDPPTGSEYTISVPNTGTLFVGIIASSYKAGTGYVSAFRVAVMNHGHNETATSVTITGMQAGDLAVDCMYHADLDPPTVNSDTALYISDTGSESRSAQYVLEGTANDVLTYSGTTNADVWQHSGAAFYTVATVTAVGASVQALWNTRAPVGAEVQALWNTRAPVGAEVQALWNVLAAIAVGAEVQVLWTTRGAVGASVQALWNTRAPVGAEVQALWNTRAPVGAVVQALWNVLAAIAVGAEVQVIWTTRAAVGASVQALWNTRKTVGAETQALWNVCTSVAAEVQALWALRKAIGAETQALWNTQAPVGATVQALWTTRVSVGAQVQALWNLHVAVGAEIEALWTVQQGSSVGASLQALWNVHAAVGKEVQLLWGTAARVLLLPEVRFGISTLEVVNKVYAVVEGSSPLVVGTATNDATAPRYSISPRETLVLVKSGNAAFATAVATAQLTMRGTKLYRLTGLPLPLRYGLGIQRGQRVKITIPRLGLTGDYPVLRLEHDFGANRSLVDIGEYIAPRDDNDAIVDARKRIAQLEKEVAI